GLLVLGYSPGKIAGDLPGYPEIVPGLHEIRLCRHHLFQPRHRKPWTPHLHFRQAESHQANDVARVELVRLAEKRHRLDRFSLLQCDHAPQAPRVEVPGESCPRSEEHTSELQSRENLVCRLLLEKK